MAYGLLAAPSWGVAGFGVALAARRIGAFRTVVIGEAAALTGYVVLFLLGPFSLRGTGPVVWLLMLAGVIGLGGYLTLYRGLESGHVGLVSAISASYAGVTGDPVGARARGAPDGGRGRRRGAHGGGRRAGLQPGKPRRRADGQGDRRRVRAGRGAVLRSGRLPARAVHAGTRLAGPGGGGPGWRDGGAAGAAGDAAAPVCGRASGAWVSPGRSGSGSFTPRPGWPSSPGATRSGSSRSPPRPPAPSRSSRCSAGWCSCTSESRAGRPSAWSSSWPDWCCSGRFVAVRPGRPAGAMMEGRVMEGSRLRRP